MAQKFAVPTMSIGRAWHHALPNKLDLIASHKFPGVEIFYEDLEHHAKALSSNNTAHPEDLLAAAHDIKKLCDARKLEILALQPFMFYEGLTDRAEHASRIQKLHLWFRLAHALGTDTIQIPANFLAEGITGDFDLIVSDMREVAQLGSQQSPPLRFVYENLCWGRFVNTWETAWDVVAAVDMANFGICLDTFNIAGAVWADPARPDGKVEGDADALLKESLEKMKKTVDVKKVFYVQVVDAEFMREPLGPGHPFMKDALVPRMGWSRNARVLPFEEGGYLPWLDVFKAIVGEDGLGFKGWISFELFSRTMAEPGADVPKEHAERMAVSRRKLMEAMGWKQ